MNIYDVTLGQKKLTEGLKANFVLHPHLQVSKQK